MNILAFVLAAFFEIGGCFAFWTWLRRGTTPLVALLGVASLVAFAVTLTRVTAPFAGRAYAHYGSRIAHNHSCGTRRVVVGLTKMKALNPRSPEDIRREIEEDWFLQGKDVP